MSLAPVTPEVQYSAPESSARRKRRRGRRVEPAVAITICAVVVLVATMVHVGQRAKIAALAYDMHQAQSRLDQLQRDQRKLVVDIENARSLGRIETEARLRLGMIRPDDQRLFVAHRVQDNEQSQLPITNSAQGARRSSWMTAFSTWYDRVSSQVRAALPRSVQPASE